MHFYVEMITSLFYFAHSKQIEVRFKRNFINFVGNMQSFHCKKFVLGLGFEVLDKINFAMREACQTFELLCLVVSRSKK